MIATWITSVLVLCIHGAAGALTNIALNKPANMSSTYGHGSLPAGGAVDGNVTTTWPNIINTEAGKPSAWWKIDLQREVQDATVEIFFRTDYMYRRNGVQLYTSTTPFSFYPGGQLCHNVSGKNNGTDIPDVVNVTCPGRWRYLFIYTKTNNDRDGPVLDFGEMHVFACDVGRYGGDCESDCTKRRCADPADFCPHQTGQCLCQVGWTGTDCTRECSPGSYGVDCAERCGQCNGTCDLVHGHCPGECLEPYRGLRCDETLKPPASGQSPYNLVTIAGVGAAAAAVVLVAVVLIVVWKRRKHREEASSRPVQDYADVQQHSTNQLRNPQPEIQVAAEQEGDSPSLNQSERPVYSNVDRQEASGEINLVDLESTITRIRQRERGFEAEYERLPEGFMAPYEDSQLPENAGKNKFKGHYPYDYNRVRLSILPGILGSDYINASFIDAKDKDKVYIAAQAPNRKTLGDFWRMIWEQQCGRVVMLTGLVEKNIVKCYQYWPENKTLDTDHFRVKLRSTDQRANSTVRYLLITSHQTGECRTVVQYHYTTWPDHDVPDTLALVNFIWMIRRTDAQSDGPLLVHCSAGIGRTGTYIAIDSLLDQARGEGKVDVQGYVSVMRGQRKNMIQTKEQYECVFHCLVEMTKYGDTSLDVDDFVGIYSKRGMDGSVDGHTFRQLAKIISAEDYKDPADQHRVWVDGNQDFIITAAPSLRNLRGHLLAVSPSPGLEKLLWKLVENNNVQNVIFVSQTQMTLNLKEEAKIKHGEITLSTSGCSRLGTDLLIANMRIYHKRNRAGRDIKLFQFGEHLTVESISSRLLDHAHLHHVTAESDPVVTVYSETDLKLAVSLCIMENIMSGIFKQNRVDVVSNVRALRRCVPNVVFSEDEMEQLYNFALKCVQLTEADRAYANL